MNLKIGVLSFGMTMLMLSCNDGTKDATPNNTALHPKDTFQEKKSEGATIDSVRVLNSLQGKWKEPVYPFRLAHFKDSTVKFVEEGVAEEPIFRAFKLSTHCPFDVNNLKNARADDLFLVLQETRTCEIIKVSNDTLTLSGFNVSTGSDYKSFTRK